MRLIEELNYIIEEALEIDNNSMINAFSEKCEKLLFEQKDQRKLKGKIVYLKYENEGNYKHTISLEVLTKTIKYKTVQGSKTTVNTYEGINTPEDVENAFKDITSKFEGME